MKAMMTTTMMMMIPTTTTTDNDMYEKVFWSLQKPIWRFWHTYTFSVPMILKKFFNALCPYMFVYFTSTETDFIISGIKVYPS
jgi:hypothetical protein